jgi:hypothetical protein
MANNEISELRVAYKDAVDEWVTAIRAEEALALPDDSITAMEHWDDAHNGVEEAQAKTVKARNAYKDALRQVNYGI